MDRSVPPLLLGIVLAAYWGRVMRMAYKIRRRTGHAANLIPEEKVGKLSRILWAPAVVMWVTYPFVAAFFWAFSKKPPLLLRPIGYQPWIAWPALGIAAACFLLSRICWRTMGRHWRMGIDPAEQNPLIAVGPFAYVRHPIYALSMLMMLASAAMLPSPLMLAAGIVHISLLSWESRREDRHLYKIHGDAYGRYREQVGGFFPRVTGGASSKSTLRQVD
ncbi:MAG TPA: isoprenylcysteine carboxylmethyltransferase family protein [Tepidisphaeraceae bacterium]|jgi:protein-S-isoprenylcysteine O-methyltransferase Ste14|nr:isoprenylcysteine carboxylmethyltransferase family protein [Tepidisphaeraceae bacterium]